MVKGFFLESRNSKRRPTKKDESRFGIQKIYGFIKARAGKIEGYSFYRFGLLKKSAGIRLQVKNFSSLTAVNQWHYFYNPTAYAPHFKHYGEVDYFLYNLADGTKKLF
jgi:hypothetical protein